MTLANEVEKRPAAAAVRKPAGDNGVAMHNAAAERDRLRMMMLIRRFEERTVKEYSERRKLPDGTTESKIGGFCHVYSGQEAIAVGIAGIFQKGKDYLINGYRCHGHSLALGMSPRSAMAELFGRETGCSKGKGGSMHFFDAQVGNMGGHGIVGGHLPVGLGLAFAQGYKKTGGVTFCLFGDGAVNQGTFHESLNMATLLKAPVIFIVENNGVAMGTQVERHSATKDLAERGSGYNMPHYNIDGNDVDVVMKELGAAADRARRMEGPSYVVANTFRFRGHSMSDPLKYRTKEEQERARLRDPIGLYATKLHERGVINEETFAAVKDLDWSGPMLSEVAEEVEEAIRQAEADPNPPLEDRFNDALAEQYPYQPE